MALTSREKKHLIKTYGKNENDSGNTKVQIAILTSEIKLLTKHLKSYPKDFNSKRSLYINNSKQRSLLKYLKRIDIEQYRDLVKKLKIRASE
jgi:small subunit ribosomal protein S15